MKDYVPRPLRSSHHSRKQPMAYGSATMSMLAAPSVHSFGVRTDRNLLY